jgi:hypothetical protein
MQNSILEGIDKASPKQAATSALFLGIGQKYGEEAALLVRPTLRKHNLDPTSTTFDRPAFERLIEKQLKK